MSWNYRMLRHEPQGQEEYLAIHEVFYDDNGNPNSCTTDPITIIGEDLQSMQWQILKIQEAIDRPILNYQHFLDIEKEAKGE